MNTHDLPPLLLPDDKLVERVRAGINQLKRRNGRGEDSSASDQNEPAGTAGTAEVAPDADGGAHAP